MFANTVLPPLNQILGALEGVVGKAEAHAVARKIAPETLLFARLYPDMFHFTRQVQVACDFAMKICARLTGAEPEKLDLSEKSFAELKALIARARSYIAATDKAVIEAAAGKTISFPLGASTVDMTGLDYAHRFAMPNFYFHVTTAYAILRENGVELAKPDFIGMMKG